MKEGKLKPITLKFIRDIKTRRKRIANFLGYKIIINKNVFPVDSPFSYSSKMTAKRIPKKAGVVLDIGTGTGVQAIVAAKRGAAKVLATDIDHNSLKNAKENVAFHKLGGIIEIRRSDLFENIRPNEKFNLIISQLPFADVNFNCSVKHFLFDYNFKLHDRFLKNAKNYLLKDGKIFIPSGSVANEKRLLELIRKYCFKVIRVEKEEREGLIWKIYVIQPMRTR